MSGECNSKALDEPRSSKDALLNALIGGQTVLPKKILRFCEFVFFQLVS